MKLFKSFIMSFILLATCASCKTKNNSDKNNSVKNNTAKSNTEQTQNQLKPRLLLTSEIGDISEISEAYTIESAEIKDNILTLSVTFDCGCNPHQFSFSGSEMIAKSLPPIRSTKLILKEIGAENSNPCKEKFSQIIDVDISTMAYQQIPGNEIYLNIEGLSERLLYTFK